MVPTVCPWLNEAHERDVGHTDHVISLLALSLRATVNASDRRVVVEENDLKWLVLEVVHHLGV